MERLIQQNEELEERDDANRADISSLVQSAKEMAQSGHSMARSFENMSRSVENLTASNTSLTGANAKRWPWKNANSSSSCRRRWRSCRPPRSALPVDESDDESEASDDEDDGV